MPQLLQVLWFAGLPVIIWLALRWRGPDEGLVQKTLSTLICAGLCWFWIVATLIPNLQRGSRQLSLQADVGDFWALAIIFPLCIYVASRAVARVNVRQAWAAVFSVLLWLGVLWGLMVLSYFTQYGRSPFTYVSRAQAID